MSDAILNRMKDAAYEQWRTESAQRRDLETTLKLMRGDRLGDVVRLGDDFVVEVHSRGDDATWTTVVRGERNPRHWDSQEEAVLHLIARRHGDRDGESVPYAARVLGIPANEES